LFKPGTKVDTGYLFAAFHSLCVGIGTHTQLSTHFLKEHRYKLSAAGESMKTQMLGVGIKAVEIRKLC
jgi:hypothetical protein